MSHNHICINNLVGIWTCALHPCTSINHSLRYAPSMSNCIISVSITTHVIWYWHTGHAIMFSPHAVSQNYYILSACDGARLGTCQFWHHQWHLCWRRVVVHDTPTCVTSSYTYGILHYQSLFAGLFGVKLACTLFTHFFTSYHFIGKCSLEQRWHPSGV